MLNPGRQVAHVFIAAIAGLSMVGCGVPEQDLASGSAGGGRVEGTAPTSPFNAYSRHNQAPTEPPPLEADAYCLVDASSGRVLASKRGWESRPVASTQKLLTALVVLDSGDLDKTVTIQREDTAVTGSLLGFQPGETFSRADLIRAMLIVSANDAALALARDVAGSNKPFADLMERKAESLGASHSHFTNPHGLTQGGQRSTAKDMAIIAMAAYDSWFIRETIGAAEQTIRSSQQSYTLQNTNELLGRLPGCTGMKTGFTPGAGVCLISSMEAEGRKLILV